jgi:hypothetical protein
VTRYRRGPRRQGVVYGPVLGRDHNPLPSLAGRILGAAVVIAALVLMVGVTYAFLGRSQPPPAAVVSPTPGETIVASPTPLLPTPVPTATPALTPTPEPTPTPAPTPFELEVREGPGAVTFGSRVDEDLRITDPTLVFPDRGRIRWVAELAEPLGASEVDIEISLLDPSDMSEEVVNPLVQEIDDENAIRILRTGRIQALFAGPGIYAVRYVRGDEVLAEGYLQIGD